MYNIMDKIIKEVSLLTKLKVMNQMFMVDMLVNAGYRDDKMWCDGEEKEITIITECAKNLAISQLKIINETK